MHPSKPRLPEILLLAALLALILLFAFIQPPPLDYTNYLHASRGDYSQYYYAYWFVPVFGLLDRLDYPAGYILWQVINLLCAWWAVRVFGGKPGLALASFQMITILWCGQIAGVILAGLALLQWGLSRRRWDLAGLGLLVAATKPQTGLLIALLFLTEVPWKERFRVLLIPSIVALLSLVIYPGWPLGLLHTYTHSPALDGGSISLWRLIGPAALLLWLPLLKVSRKRRPIALVATMSLALPYFQQADLVILFAMPTGVLPLLGNIGYPLLFTRGWNLQVLSIVPSVLLVWIYLCEYRDRAAAGWRFPFSPREWTWWSWTHPRLKTHP